ncbi:hypothetical protein QEL93_002963 [Pseudomonas putida]|nr:hypothetical protein [Pseudomonas putida]
MKDSKCDLGTLTHKLALDGKIDFKPTSRCWPLASFSMLGIFSVQYLAADAVQHVPSTRSGSVALVKVDATLNSGQEGFNLADLKH